MAMLQTGYSPFSASSTSFYPPRSPPPSRRLIATRSASSPVITSSFHETARQPTQSPSLTRHHDLWFIDGSVVLQTGNAIFRVHKSQLSRHSPFFRDLFSLPQPTQVDVTASTSSQNSPVLRIEPSDEIEGCPVVRLHDSSEDVANLLTALYDGPAFGNNDPVDFRVVSGILRLATKYLVDSLRSKAIGHLSEAWPSTLKGWDAREDAARASELQNGLGANGIYPSPISVINLAREVDAPSLLPSAFYDLSRYHYSQIFDPDNGVDCLHPYLPLSGQDMQRLVLGKEAAQQAIITLIQGIGSNVHSTHTPVAYFHPSHHRTGSHSHHACRKDFSELVSLATQHYLFDKERGCTDPLYAAEELGQPLYDFGGQTASGGEGARAGEPLRGEASECEACARLLEMWASRERERMWKMIPLWFRLDV